MRGLRQPPTLHSTAGAQATAPAPCRVPCRQLQRPAGAAHNSAVAGVSPLPLHPAPCAAAGCSRGQLLLVRASLDPDDIHETKLGPNVAAGIKDVKDGLTWRPATVIRNEGVNLASSHRLLHMSVSDEVDMLYGRRIQPVPEQVRWIESFTVPGQFVGVRMPGSDTGSAGSSSSTANGSSSSSGGGGDGGGGSKGSGLADSKQLYAIACSPYESRRDSAYIGGSIIEVVVDKSAGGDQAVLADLAPGSSIEVSQIVGRGFASLFNSYCGLPSSLEEQRNILVLAVGLKGIAATRAVLNWAPVQAHATSHKVACYYVTKSPSSAAFLAEWDQWREAGVSFNPLYTEALLQRSASPGDAAPRAANGSSGSGSGSGSGSSEDAAAAASADAAGDDVTAEDILGLLEQGLFLHEHGLESVLGGKASEATVLLAGIRGDIASTVAKELTFKGVAWERLLFCDYF